MSSKIRIAGQVGFGGVLVAALSCAGCFPALGALAGAIGLGFLSQFEGVMINKLLPLFTLLVLLINGYGWFRHRVHWRGLLSILGPSVVLASLYPFWHYALSSNLFYAALILMLVLSVVELFKSVKSSCALPRVEQ